VERVLDSYAELVAAPAVEVVYNPMANAFHGPWNRAAIAAGKHVLSEKPFASDADEAKEVRDAEARAGVIVVEGFHYLYHPVTRQLHELLASGELGERGSCRGRSHHDHPDQNMTRAETTTRNAAPG